MRLALARRYFDAGEFTPALDHYMIILDTEQNPEALANVGWMTYLSGRPDVAATFVEESLVRDPSYLPAIWFLANIRFEGLDDPAGAREPLERLIAADGVPDDVRGAAEAMLEEVRSGS
jgi:tetratricopeptide (TPR) repeat protein